MKIIHPTDFSECAEQARALAVQLARALGAELILLYVAVEAPLFREGLTRPGALERFFDEQREWARRALEERAAEARGQGVPTLARLVTGAPHQAIVETAKGEGAALIVMGTHGRGALERFFLGSVADRVIRAAPCPVVTRRETMQEEPPEPPIPGLRDDRRLPRAPS
jgi:nucleotide-binding universal stress UspA family protein